MVSIKDLRILERRANHLKKLIDDSDINDNRYQRSMQYNRAEYGALKRVLEHLHEEIDL